MSADSIVTLEQVTKSFGSFVALHEIDLAIAEGEFVTLLGPSGCGKTTTLRLIGGFEAADRGRIRIAHRRRLRLHDRVAHAGVPDHERGIDADAVLLERKTLLFEICRTAAVGVEDGERDALRQQRARIAERRIREAAGRMRVHVDESRRHQTILRVDRDGGRRTRKTTDGRDAITPDADVRAKPRVAGSIHDARVGNKDVEGRLCALSGNLFESGQAEDQHG